MLERIIEISENSARIKIDNHLLQIILPDESKYTVVLEEVGVLLLSNAHSTITAAALSQIAENGGIVVCCNEKYMPSGMLLPLQKHYEQTARFAAQISIPKARNKQLWREIVAAKIHGQSELLKKIKTSDSGLSKLIPQIKSDDSTNIEGLAARIYWQSLGMFERRDRSEDGVNSLLNYGYTILHSCCSRAICAVGLHPSIGIHHHNGYNPFVLASDLMEPYRVIIDQAVWGMYMDNNLALTKNVRGKLIQTIIDGVFEVDGREERLFNALSLTAEAVARIYLGKSERFVELRALL